MKRQALLVVVIAFTAIGISHANQAVPQPPIQGDSDSGKFHRPLFLESRWDESLPRCARWGSSPPSSMLRRQVACASGTESKAPFCASDDALLHAKLYAHGRKKIDNPTCCQRGQSWPSERIHCERTDEFVEERLDAARSFVASKRPTQIKRRSSLQETSRPTVALKVLTVSDIHDGLLGLYAALLGSAWRRR